MTDIAERLARRLRKMEPISRGRDIPLITELREAAVEITRLLSENAKIRRETIEEVARIIDSMPARSNYAIYDHLAAAIRALAENTGGENP